MNGVWASTSTPASMASSRHPVALDVGDDRQTALAGGRDDRGERRCVEDRPDRRVQRDLDDGCPERRLLVDRRRGAAGDARVGRGVGHLAHDRGGAHDRPTG